MAITQVLAELALIFCISLLALVLVRYLQRRAALLSVRPPEVGQVWVCMKNMKKYMVTSVTTCMSGTIDVSLAMEGPGPYGFGMGDSFAYGIEHWRELILSRDMQFLYMAKVE